VSEENQEIEDDASDAPLYDTVVGLKDVGFEALVKRSRELKNSMDVLGAQKKEIDQQVLAYLKAFEAPKTVRVHLVGEGQEATYLRATQKDGGNKTTFDKGVARNYLIDKVDPKIVEVAFQKATTTKKQAGSLLITEEKSIAQKERERELKASQ
jgi:hypothetical protein